MNQKEGAEERKITPEAVSLVQDMATWVHKTLLKLKRYINEKSKESEVLKRWEESKTKFSNLFRRSRDLRSETEAVKDKIDNFEQAKKHFADVIDSKLELIEEHLKDRKFWDGMKKTWLDHWLPMLTAGFLAVFLGGFFGWGTYGIANEIFKGLVNLIKG